MKKNIFKRMIVSILALSLVFSFSGPASAASHAANGSDVVPDSLRWSSMSVRDDLHDMPMTDWEKALIEEMDKAKAQVNADYKAGKIDETTRDEELAKIDEWQSYTEGWIPDADNKAHNFDFWCKNSGWDGEYAAQSRGGEKTLVGDNPWGLTATMEKIPVEYGRYYTLDFDIYSELEKDLERSDKQILVKAYDYQSRGEPSAAFETVKVDGKDAAKDGKFVIKKTPKGEDSVVTHFTGTFKIPDSKNEWSGGHDKGAFTYMGIKFAMGAFLKTREEEVGLKGMIHIKNLKVIAGTQYAVRYYDGSVQKDLRYVNEYDQAKYIALKKKGYTQTGYVDMATGSKFSFGTLIEKDTNLKATWTKTQKPKKASFKVKSKKKKKATVTFGKNANAKGYEVKYSYNKKFKKKAKYKTKTKTTSKTSTYTIKSLKSSKVLYVKARAFNKDSCGNKVYGKWSKRKNVYVK